MMSTLDLTTVPIYVQLPLRGESQLLSTIADTVGDSR